MSGMLDISENVAWMPAGWVFDGVVELIAPELKTENPSLAAASLQARTETTGYCDIRTLDATQFRSLLEAVERTYARLLEEKCERVSQCQISCWIHEPVPGIESASLYGCTRGGDLEGVN